MREKQQVLASTFDLLYFPPDPKNRFCIFLLQDPKEREIAQNERAQTNSTLHILSLEKMGISKANLCSVIYSSCPTEISHTLGPSHIERFKLDKHFSHLSSALDI